MTKEENLHGDTLLSLAPMPLLDYLRTIFPVPQSAKSEDLLDGAADKLAGYASFYSYFSQLSLAANVRKRMLKRDGAEKEEVEEMLTREQIFSKYADMAKMGYNAVSRIITVKQQEAEEAKGL